MDRAAVGWRLAVVVVLAPLLAGCPAPVAHDDYANATPSAASRRAEVGNAGIRGAGPAVKKKKGPKDQYFAIQGKKKAQNAFGFTRLSLDLWAPFVVEGSVGLYDPKKVAVSNLARMFLELDERASNPLEFFGIGSEVTNGGLNIFAYAHTSQSALGSQFFPGITEADVQIEADASNLYFRARPHGTEGWTLLATHAFAGQNAPLLPALGSSNLSNGAKTGFDRFQVLENGPPAGVQSLRQQLARKIWDAAQLQARAFHIVDGGEPDFAGAQTHLDNAAPLLDDAIAFAPGVDLGSTSDNQKVAKSLNQAKTALTQARSFAAAAKQAAKILSQLKTAITKQSDAVGIVNPEAAPP